MSLNNKLPRYFDSYNDLVKVSKGQMPYFDDEKMKFIWGDIPKDYKIVGYLSSWKNKKMETTCKIYLLDSVGNVIIRYDSISSSTMSSVTIFFSHRNEHYYVAYTNDEIDNSYKTDVGALRPRETQLIIDDKLGLIEEDKMKECSN